MEQTVDFPLQGIPQEPISERIVEQIVDEISGPAGEGTLRAAVAASAAAKCPKEKVFFALFPRRKKVRHPGASRVRHLVRTRAHGRRRLMRSRSRRTSTLTTRAWRGGGAGPMRGRGTSTGSSILMAAG